MDLNIAELPPHVLAIGGLILAFAAFFILFFMLPAVRVRWNLGRILKALRDDQYKGPVDLATAFEGRGVLKHLWSEYRETLHEEKILNPQTGLQEVARLRATQPAGVFFTDEVVVDTPVRSEFFKHLPGILTGIGIIGTFFGLILGLQGFQVSEDPRSSERVLKHLSRVCLKPSWSRFLPSLSRWPLRPLRNGYSWVCTEKQRS